MAVSQVKAVWTIYKRVTATPLKTYHLKHEGVKFCQYILVPRHGYCFVWQFSCIIQFITIQ